MVIMALMGLLMGASHADVGFKHTNKHLNWPGTFQANNQSVNANKSPNQAIPNNTPIFFDNDTLLAPNAQGEMVMYNIVDLTWELDIPGGPGKINVTGTADKVIDYINVHFPDYVWPDVRDLNTTSPEKAAQDDPKPNCNVFDLAPYPVAQLVQEIVAKLGSHYFNLGSGPRTCAQVECRNNFGDRHAAIWWCNDVSETPRSLSFRSLICLHKSRC